VQKGDILRMKPCYTPKDKRKSKVSKRPCRIVWSMGWIRFESPPSWSLPLGRAPCQEPASPWQLLRPPRPCGFTRSALVGSLLISRRLLRGISCGLLVSRGSRRGLFHDPLVCGLLVSRGHRRGLFRGLLVSRGRRRGRRMRRDGIRPAPARPCSTGKPPQPLLQRLILIG
jgi:hypothetical protein